MKFPELFTKYPLRFACSVASSRRGKNRLLILCYHRVLPKPDPMLPGTIDGHVFSKHLATLVRNFQPILLRDAVELLRIGKLPERTISVTFDDGYADNLDVALPILQHYRVPATVFVATNYMNGGCMWNDSITEVFRRAEISRINMPEIGLPPFSLSTDSERAAAARSVVLRLRRMSPMERQRHTETLINSLEIELPTDLMLTTEGLRSMHRAGVEIGAHTMSHPILTRLSQQDAADEISRSRGLLQDIVSDSVAGFAYPNGQPGVDFDKNHLEMVENSGYSYAVTTARGTTALPENIYQLPRLDPWEINPLRYEMRLILEYLSPPSALV